MATIWDMFGQPAWATRIEQNQETIMAALQETIDQIVTQLAKAKDEIVAKIADLETQIAAGETPDLGPLTEAAQALDDVIPDTLPEPLPSPVNDL